MRYTGHVISKHKTMLGWYEKQENTISTRIFDQGTYSRAYTIGYAEPHYQVPATTLNALLAVPFEAITPITKQYLLSLPEQDYNR